MEELIALYFFKNKLCPLPGIGSLHTVKKSAFYDQAEQQMYPPVASIVLSDKEKPLEDFVRLISATKKITINEAERELIMFCNSLQNSDAYHETIIPATGKFFVDAEGILVFRQSTNPENYLPVVPATRIIHPESSHSILVGDKESTSAIMTEYLSEDVTINKKRWWIAALIIFLIGISVIIFYFLTGDTNGKYGNTVKVPVGNTHSTYSTGN